MTDAITITGLNEFVRKLKKLDSDLPKAVRLAGNEAVQIVLADAKPKVPRRSGRAAASMKAASTTKTARIRAGGNKAVYYPWLDFGGHVGIHRSVSRPMVKSGRYIWKSFAGNKEKVREAYQDGILEVARSAGLDVS